MKLELTHDGRIAKCTSERGEITFRDDMWSGFRFITRIHGKDNYIELHEDDGAFRGELRGIRYMLSYEETGRGFLVHASVENTNPVVFMPEWVALRTGISHYMESWPQWDGILFPTLERCEREGFYGYFSSPDGKVLAFTSPDPVAAWKNCYNRIEEEDEGDYCLTYLDGGHRIYTSDFHLMNRKIDNDRYPVSDLLRPGEEKSWNFEFTLLEDRSLLPSHFAEGTGMPFIRCSLYSAETGQSVRGTVHSVHGIRCAELVHDATEGKMDISVSGDGTFVTPPLEKSGTYTMTVTDLKGRTGEAKLFVQRKGLWYLDRAMDAVLADPPCPTHHMECFVSLYTLLYGEIYLGRKEEKAYEIFDFIIDSLYDKELGHVKYAADMRIQDTACMGALLALKYTITKDPEYLGYATRLADFLAGLQGDDGAYYAHRTSSKSVHYTCVSYLAAFMYAIGKVEITVPGSEGKGREHIRSAERAVMDVLDKKDLIETEGEATFEDGMITCAVHQLTMWALDSDDPVLVSKLTEASEYLYRKHLCLDQDYVPDCRMNGATLRFWEAQYNLSIFSDLINSPCGWSAWRIYGSWNLYRLTRKKEYFYSALNCMRACLQLIDDETGKLRWGFTPDPYIITEAFVPDNGGEVRSVKVSEQYLDMASTWHRTIPFPRPKWGIDNLVHECFKAYSEIYVPNAAVLEDDGLVTMNCDACSDSDGNIVISGFGPGVRMLDINFISPHKVVVDGTVHEIRSGTIPF